MPLPAVEAATTGQGVTFAVTTDLGRTFTTKAGPAFPLPELVPTAAAPVLLAVDSRGNVWCAGPVSDPGGSFGIFFGLADGEPNWRLSHVGKAGEVAAGLAWALGF